MVHYIFDLLHIQNRYEIILVVFSTPFIIHRPMGFAFSGSRAPSIRDGKDIIRTITGVEKLSLLINFNKNKIYDSLNLAKIKTVPHMPAQITHLYTISRFNPTGITNSEHRSSGEQDNFLPVSHCYLLLNLKDHKNYPIQRPKPVPEFSAGEFSGSFFPH